MTEFATLVKEQGLEEEVVINPAGMVTHALCDAVRNAFDQGPGLIRVEGEEDLALMPVILEAPEGSDVIYGWPGKGMMILVIDQVIKQRTQQLWKEMEESE